MIDSLQLFWRMISTLCDEFIIFFLKTLFYISKLNEKKKIITDDG